MAVSNPWKAVLLPSRRNWGQARALPTPALLQWCLRDAGRKGGDRLLQRVLQEVVDRGPDEIRAAAVTAAQALAVSLPEVADGAAADAPEAVMQRLVGAWLATGGPEIPGAVWAECTGGDRVLRDEVLLTTVGTLACAAGLPVARFVRLVAGLADGV